jgi:hypothetical protein
MESLHDLQQPDEVCPDCGSASALRQCCACGRQGYVIDCGHYAQPRPLAAGRADGSRLWETYCTACATEALEADESSSTC